jgi:1-acyl-sn-glycerol-3-phosphate acyltransferase
MVEAHLNSTLVVAAGQRTPGSYGALSVLAGWVMRLAGWRIEIVDPMPERCVIVMYPHTSNWDFPVGLLTKWAVGLDFKREKMCFAGKESLFKGPWAGFFRAVGGFPVNRRSASGFVPQMAERFAREPRMRFVIAPEGTRSYSPHVRSSFYFIAVAANVPILLGAFDFPGKRVIVNAAFMPSGDAANDLADISAYYKNLGNQGAKPDQASPWTFRA